MIVVVGLSHRTAPIDVRERLAIAPERIPTLLTELTKDPQVREAMLISTCNRLELVAAGPWPRPDQEETALACELFLEREASGIGRHLYRHTGALAIRHLFRVASSLDSLVLGEPQILGQVKEAFEQARGAGTLGSILHRTLPRALHAAKRVRTETQVGSGQVSVPSVAVDLTRQIFGDPRGRSVLLVGSGEMAESAARLLKAAGARIFVVGRTPERVQALCDRVGGEPRAWSDLRATLVEVDVVITSTSARGFVIDREMVAGSRRSRRGRDQFFVDLAVPRDVDPEVIGLDGAFLYNIDDLSRTVSETLSSRQREADAAERLVEEETRGYERWADAEQATPTIVQLRAKIREAFGVELDRSLKGRLKHLGAEDRAALSKLIEAAENRVLHGPTMRLRQAASDPQGPGMTLADLAEAVRELFELDESPAPEAASDPHESAADKIGTRSP